MWHKGVSFPLVCCLVVRYRKAKVTQEFTSVERYGGVLEGPGWDRKGHDGMRVEGHGLECRGSISPAKVLHFPVR